jgi:signal transduction histidine kinase
MKTLERVARRLDPRRSVAGRLLFAFFLTSFIPAAVFMFVFARRLSDLQESSLQRLSAVKVAEAGIRIDQDASYRAEWLERRVKTAEETAWSLAGVVQAALMGTVAPGPARGLPPPDEHGHVWNTVPEVDSVGFLQRSQALNPQARRDAERLAWVARPLLMARERRSYVRNISVWTASGAMLRSPWVDIHESIAQSGGALENWGFNRLARFPEVPPATGEKAVWLPAFSGPRMTLESRLVGLFVPVRDAAGKLLAGVSLGIDASRFFAEAAEAGELQGDFWCALDGEGHAILMTARAAALLKWRGDANEALADSPDAERRALAKDVLGSARSASGHLFEGKRNRFASAKVPTTGWIFLEGLSGDALREIEDEAVQEGQPERFRILRRDLLFLFAYLFLAVLVIVGLLSKRFSAPVEELVRAAEDIGEGRAVELSASRSPDELGRLGAALDRMGKRVERRVETLRRLHTLLRTTYRTTDLREVLARCAEASAAFTRAEKVIFFLHNADTNRLEAAWPGWNITAEVAEKMKIPVEGRSIAGMVFRSGDVYATNDLGHDPYAFLALQEVVGPAQSGVFAPLKTEDRTIGVAVALNRPGGFGHEEVDAMTSFADAASLLIANARLYETLTGTVEELRRASRLKDQFLQNVNHELRTPLTSIVGWTDLFEEDALDSETLKRGQRQVRQSARILLALIDDLLDLARMDRGALVLDLRAVHIAEVIQRSLETVRMMSEAQGVAMILAPLPEDMPPLRADPLRLQQILWNLLTNAIKFTRRHGRVVVRVEQEGERYRVAVEDDGIGIPESEIAHVFERFRQVDGSPTRRHAGMGIGLSLTRSLVELHGGTIWAESMVGHGSRFTFTLPIRPVRAGDAHDEE